MISLTQSCHSDPYARHPSAARADATLHHGTVGHASESLLDDAFRAQCLMRSLPGTVQRSAPVVDTIDGAAVGR